MPTNSGDDADAIIANPTRSGHIPKVTAKVADIFHTLIAKRPRKQVQKKVVESSPSTESLAEASTANNPPKTTFLSLLIINRGRSRRKKKPELYPSLHSRKSKAMLKNIM